MKKLILILCLISSACFAQDTTQQRIETIIGKLIIENANLTSTIDNLNKQIADLKRKLEEKG